MENTFLSQAILIDTSAMIALADPRDRFHEAAESFYSTTTGVVWVSLNATAHETYTRARYDLGFNEALRLYDFLLDDPFLAMPFTPEDEAAARKQLVKFQDHKMSFHDALFAGFMLRKGIYRTFAFDRHFFVFGFEVLPGPVR